MVVTLFHVASSVEFCRVMVAPAIPLLGVPLVSVPLIVKFWLRVTFVGEALAVRVMEDDDSNA